MRLLPALLLILFSTPVMACEGFDNAMDALEHAMGIEQPESPQLPQTKKPVEQTARKAVESKPETPPPPVTTRNTL